MQSYSSIEPKLDTGDLVLFAGKGFSAGVIKRMTFSRWAHVGVVLRHSADEEPLLWESTTLRDLVDVKTGRAQAGVRLVRLKEAVQLYPGEIAIRHLTCERPPEFMQAVLAFCSEVHSRPYERCIVQLTKAAYDGIFGHNTKADLTSLFCSELVAEAYQRVGLLGTHLPSNEYTPADFSTERALELLCGATLTEEILVVPG